MTLQHERKKSMDKPLKAIKGQMIQQTEMFMPIHDKYGERILRQGYKPFLEGIVEDVRKLWNRRQWLPMTFLSRLPEGIDYWEPSWDKSFRAGVAISMSQRNMSRYFGLTEQLQVFEGWHLDEDRNRDGRESLFVAWHCRYDTLAFQCAIAQGKYRRYAEQPRKQTDDTIYNPMLWPWNTNDDIAEFWNVPTDERADLDALLDKAMNEAVGATSDKEPRTWIAVSEA
jgi:hypothetical protein